METKEILTIIADNIKALMNQKKVSGLELARECKISSGTISKITNGNTIAGITTLIQIAEGLGVSIDNILDGLPNHAIEKPEKTTLSEKDFLSIGIMSINNRRLTCIKDYTGNIVGKAELGAGIDLARTTGDLMEAIQDAISYALPDSYVVANHKNIQLNLVAQSYEFEHSRKRFTDHCKKIFRNVDVIPDWQLTFLAAFPKKEGISLIVDKGVSLSYKKDGRIQKLGGWKFPVYDLGGENWLGLQTIQHTIEAVEGHIPMSKLAKDVFAKYGKLEMITETCFTGSKNPDIYCEFSALLLWRYLAGDKTAKAIIKKGYTAINRLITRVDAIFGKKLPICINGSLSEVYTPFFEKKRLVKAASNDRKVALLAGLNT